MKTLLAILTLALFAFTASAADIAGTWKAATPGPDGNTFETTFVFKVDGAKVTGSTSNQFMQDTPISEGKIDGDNLTFVVVASFNGNEIKLNYKAKVTGTDMTLNVELVGRDRTFEMKAKKAS
jgi:hypothetical protein